MGNIVTIDGQQIPTVGDPYSMEGWFSTVVICCKVCDKNQTVILVGANPVMCPHCRTIFQCIRIMYDLRDPNNTDIQILSRKQGPAVKEGN